MSDEVKVVKTVEESNDDTIEEGLFSNAEPMPWAIRAWLASAAIMFAIWAPIALALSVSHPELMTTTQGYWEPFNWGWLSGPMYAELYAYLVGFWLVVSGSGGGIALAIWLLKGGSNLEGTDE